MTETATLVSTLHARDPSCSAKGTRGNPSASNYYSVRINDPRAPCTHTHDGGVPEVVRYLLPLGSQLPEPRLRAVELLAVHPDVGAPVATEDVGQRRAVRPRDPRGRRCGPAFRPRRPPVCGR